jgi:hypothetical protein
MTWFQFSLRLSNFPWLFSLSIHQLLGTSADSSLTIVKRAAINMVMQVFSFLWIWQSHKVGLFLVFWGTSILISIVVILIYIPTNIVWRFLSPLHHCQPLLLFIFLLMANLTGVRQSLSTVLICISFMAKDVKHCFMYLLAIYISSSENYLFHSFAYLLIGLVILLFTFLSSLYILDINPLSVE